MRSNLARWHPAEAVLQLQLRQNNLPHAHELWIRYDPPVLVVVITWHQTAVKFGKLLYDLLSISYAGNEDSVRAPPAWVFTLRADPLLTS